MSSFYIGNRELKAGVPPYVVAEIGVNFDGDLDVAKASIAAAAEAGAAAAKFQTFRAEEFLADGRAIYEYKTDGGVIRETLSDMFRRLELPDEWHQLLVQHCWSHNVDFLSSPADVLTYDLLASCGVPAIKIASTELINLPLLHHASRHKIPVIVSTGMASAREIDEGLEILATNEAPPILLLHCVSLYPTPDDEANLLRLSSLIDRYKLPTGYSDHTLGADASAAAVALGAVFIEKHFTLNKGGAGPDHALSADPGELAELVRRVNRTANLMGTGNIDPGPTENEAARKYRRSIVAARAIKAGEVIDEQAITLKWPGGGLHPREAKAIIGKTAATNIGADQIIKWEDIQ